MSDFAKMVHLLRRNSAKLSERRRAHADDALLRAAITGGLEFCRADFYLLEFGGTEPGGERFYSHAVQEGNLSFCRAFEELKGRPPLIWDKQRLHVGRQIRWAERWLWVTSFADDFRGWYALCAERQYDGGRHRNVRLVRVYESELRAGAPQKQPRLPSEVYQVLRLFRDDVLWHPDARRELRRAGSLATWWARLTGPEAESDYEFGRLLDALSLRWAKGEKLDFEADVLPRLRAEIAKRDAAAKERRRQEIMRRTHEALRERA